MTPVPGADTMSEPSMSSQPQVCGQGLHWHALTEARKQQRPRRAFVVDGEHVGSVDEAHLTALGPWARWLEVREQAVVLTAGAADREAVFAEVNARLREHGLIRAWRNEPFALFSPSSGAVLAVFERAAARFWGTLTLGAHCNGWVAGPDGRPAALWIARRSLHKPTDPGLLDNLVGGGVPWGQTPWEALVREGFEEAGLSTAQMARATPGEAEGDGAPEGVPVRLREGAGQRVARGEAVGAPLSDSAGESVFDDEGEGVAAPTDAVGKGAVREGVLHAKAVRDSVGEAEGGPLMV